MKQMTLDVIKKNRVYFACKNEGGYNCKLRINDASKDLTLGKHALLLNDESVRTKYGTDLIYSLQAEIKETGIVTLSSAYNQHLVEACRKLGGKWDSINSVWVFSKIVESEVEELDYIYNSELWTVEVHAEETDVGKLHGPVSFLGYTLAKATGRDSGAVLGDGVALIKGSIGSGGSMKNWHTYISDDSVFRLNVPRRLLESIDEFPKTYWVFKIID